MALWAARPAAAALRLVVAVGLFVGSARLLGPADIVGAGVKTATEAAKVLQAVIERPLWSRPRSPAGPVARRRWSAGRTGERRVAGCACLFFMGGLRFVADVHGAAARASRFALTFRPPTGD